LDDVALRFLNKRSGEVKPDSVKVYKSRVQSAIRDFMNYRADPLNFKVGLTPKPSFQGRPEKNSARRIAPDPALQAPPAQHHAFVSPSEMELALPILLRPDKIVKIIGLPSDLTKQEATRLANIVLAFATVNERDKMP
jgi:hypothetical protein